MIYILDGRIGRDTRVRHRRLCVWQMVARRRRPSERENAHLLAAAYPLIRLRARARPHALIKLSKCGCVRVCDTGNNYVLLAATTTAPL